MLTVIFLDPLGGLDDQIIQQNWKMQSGLGTLMRRILESDQAAKDQHYQRNVYNFKQLSFF